MPASDDYYIIWVTHTGSTKGSNDVASTKDFPDLNLDPVPGITPKLPVSCEIGSCYNVMTFIPNYFLDFQPSILLPLHESATVTLHKEIELVENVR